MTRIGNAHAPVGGGSKAIRRGAKLLNPARDNDMDCRIEALLLYQDELERQNEALRSLLAGSERQRTKYSAMFQSMPLVAIVLDDDGLILDSNRLAVQRFGFQNSALMRDHSIRRLLKNRGDNWLLQALRHRSEEDVAMVPGLELIDNARQTVVMDAYLIRLHPESPRDAQTLALLVDRSKEQAHDSERLLLLQAVLDGSNSAVYAVDQNGVCILANRTLLQLTGRNESDVLGQKQESWWPLDPTDRQQAGDIVDPLKQEAAVFEEKLTKGSDEARYFVSNRFPLKDAAGDVFAVGGITSEVTQSRKVELQLQLAMQVFSKGREGIIITDQDHRIVKVNKAFERITGYASAEVIGRDPRFLSSGRQSDAFYQEIWDCLAVDGFWEGEIWNRRKNGEAYPEWLNVSPVCNDAGQVTNYIALFNDLTRRKIEEQEIERLAFYDTLTGSANRYLLENRVNQTIHIASRNAGRFALLFMDLDRFKEINDVFGHEVGDELLKEVARRIQPVVRAKDTVSRLGGDEFILLMTDITRNTTVERVKDILSRVAEPYAIGTHKLTLSTSIGVAFYPDDALTYKELLKSADTAMYQAKANGRGTYSLFNAKMAEQVQAKVSMEQAMRLGLELGEFWVAYQPQVCLVSGRILGVEALLRWNSSELGVISPDVFIPVAEESGLIIPLGLFVFREALEQIRRLRDAGFASLTVSVNISAHQFWKEDLPTLIEKLLIETGTDGHCLELELTEGVAMTNPEAGIVIMQRLRATGIRMSIDDFGTGYSSLAYLKRLPIDVLKIDKSFVHDIGLNQDDEVVCRSIIQLANTLGIRTIAEGVETGRHVDFLRANDCVVAQGHLFSKALPAAELLSFLADIETAADGTTQYARMGDES
jgi:two-component system CheB/CheR fusion protein